MYLLFTPLISLSLLILLSSLTCLVRAQGTTSGVASSKTITTSTTSTSWDGFCQKHNICRWGNAIRGVNQGLSSSAVLLSSSNIGPISSIGPSSGPSPSSSPSASLTFIPTDKAAPPNLPTPTAALMARQNSLNSQYLYQISPYLIDAATMRSFTGSIIETLYGRSAALDNRTQAVLSHGERDSPNVT